MASLKTGPHGAPATKRNSFLPWLIRGTTAVKHKGPADALAFHSSKKVPTSSQTMPKYIHDMLELPPCSLDTHTHTRMHNALIQIYTCTCLCGALNGGGEGRISI